MTVLLLDFPRIHGAETVLLLDFPRIHGAGTALLLDFPRIHGAETACLTHNFIKAIILHFFAKIMAFFL